MNSSVTRSIANNEIYLGFWINHSYGKIRGATLTLSRRDGGLLTAFLALFVTIAGTEFWRIACFIIHHLLSSEIPRDGIHHQRQAILRNAANGISGLWSLLRMNWVWRKDTRAQPYSRILPLITFTVITLTAFALAGIFSSQVSTSMGNEVLLHGSNCGYIVPEDVGPEGYWETYLPYSTQSVVSSANYAQRCYESDSLIQDCPTFLHKSLPWTSKDDAECPFPGQRICRSNSTNLRLDTGYINSNFDLGINSPPEDRFLYRNLIQCAPLNTEGYSENVTIFSKGDNTSSNQIMKYYYGRMVWNNGTQPLTYQYSAYSPIGGDSQRRISSSAAPDYTIHTMWAYKNLNGSFKDGSFSPYLPIPELQHPAADITLVFLSANDIRFVKPSDDSLYSAHLTTSLEMSSSSKTSAYLRDDPVRALACVSQYQFCNPTLKRDIACTPPDGIMPVQALAQSLWQSEKQKALISWSASKILYDAIGLPEVLTSLGISSLTSRYKLRNGIQGPLPSNQWQLEVKHWFRTTLADLQRSVVETATGTMGMSTQWMRQPQTPEERLLCRSQVKIRNDSFMSFSTLGLTILLGVGGLMITISYTLECIVELIQKRTNSGLYNRLDWTINETLQFQRLAHEELGFGTWTRTAQDHPITAPGEKLAVLDVSEPDHPKLARPAPKPKASSQGGSDQGGTDNNSIRQTKDQAVPKTGLSHTTTFISSGSTIIDSTSSENKCPPPQRPNTRRSVTRPKSI